MNPPDNTTAVHILLIGIGATAVLDAWLLLLRRLGQPSAGFAPLGRWIGHLARGRLTHPAIAQAAPVRHELALGWLSHYAVGVAFAAALVAWQGMAWVRQPTPLPALAFGLASVVAPLFVMQPAMGAGFASRRTAAPLKNCLRSTLNHMVFGVGLYLCARLLAGAPAAALA